MAYPTFVPPFNPMEPLEISSQPRFISAKFGDGYAQNSLDGLNAEQISFDLIFEPLSFAQYQAIDGFFSNNPGAVFIYALPIDGVNRFWVATKRVPVRHGTYYSISISITQVFPAYQFLDLVSVQPTVVFSLRNTNAAYAGKCINVRRSSDNAMLDIGFFNQNLDTVTLLGFVGSGSGYVTTWYDQSGNGYNAVQATAANQPLIVSGGVLETLNSKPSLLFTSTSANANQSLRANFTGSTTAQTVSVVFQGRNYNPNPAAGINNLYDGVAADAGELRFNGASAIRILGNNGGAIGYNSSYTASQINTSLYAANSSSSFLNGSLAASGAIGTVSTRGLTIANYGGNSRGFDGWIPEIINYQNVLSNTDRQVIESNQSAYFGIPIA